MSLIREVLSTLQEINREVDTAIYLRGEELTYLSEDSLADIGAELGARNPHEFGKHVRHLLDRDISQNEIAEYGTPWEKAKNWLGFKGSGKAA